jgi:hypothetical protein
LTGELADGSLFNFDLVIGNGFDEFDPAATLMVTLVPPLAGDFDLDGDVDADDLLDWTMSFQTTNVADADYDGDSDGTDFLLWQRLVGTQAPVASAIGVPEPGRAWPAALALLLSARNRRSWRGSDRGRPVEDV